MLQHLIIIIITWFI